MNNKIELRTVNTTRYITPLREGGSLPALAEADDEFKYVLKFRGTGHGPKALISELIGGEVARLLGFRIPELVFINLDEAFGRSEGDEEVQDLLKASQGLNIALHFLDGAVTFDPVAYDYDEDIASKLVWMDAFLTNIDRTVKNTNLLVWKRDIWLIDHGSILYFQHSWDNWEKQALSPFAYIKDHVMLPKAKHLDIVNELFKEILTDDKLREIVSLIPNEWLDWPDLDMTPDQIRDIYSQFLIVRKSNSELFTKEAQNARKNLI
jgi:hypothetical protein